MSQPVPLGLDPNKIAGLAWLTYEEPADLVYMVKALDSYWLGEQKERRQRQQSGTSKELDKSVDGGRGNTRRSKRNRRR